MLAFGDLLEWCLRAVGITKDRVSRWTGRADCGCPERQAALNRWGFLFQSALGFPMRWAWYKWHGSTFGMRFWLAGRHFYQAFRVLFWGA